MDVNIVTLSTLTPVAAGVGFNMDNKD